MNKTFQEIRNNAKVILNEMIRDADSRYWSDDRKHQEQHEFKQVLIFAYNCNLITWEEVQEKEKQFNNALEDYPCF